MRIQKEIENVERVKDKIATMPLTMEDAIEFHKQVVDRVEKERKEINKELDLDDDIEEKGFTGASKEPKKVSTPELKKMKLSEALFKPLNENWVVVTRDEDDDSLIDGAVFSSLSNAKKYLYQLKREEPEYDNVYYDIEEVDPRGFFADEEPLDESLNEGYRTVNEIYRDIENFLRESDLDGDLIIESEDWINIDCRDEDREHVIDVLQSAGYDVDYDDYDDYVKIYVGDLYESLNECDKFKKGDCKNYALDEAKISRQNQRRKKDAYLQRKEAEREKAEKEARERERIGDAAWGEKDWIAEREKGDLDFSNYSDEERAEIEKRLKAFDENPTAKAQYQRKKAEEERKKAEEERKKAEQEKEEKIKKNIETIGKAAKAPGELLNAVKKGLNIK